MSLGLLQLAGIDLSEAVVYVPNQGVPFADCQLTQGPTPSGLVVLQLGDLALSCTVDPEHSGAFGEQQRARVLCGAGAWGSLLAPRGYSNDAGVKASLVASDAARECGETLDASSLQVRLGAAYAREAGPAWRTLEDALRGAPWRVDFDGVTRLGARPAGSLAQSALLLSWDAQSLTAEFAVDSLLDVPIGAVIPADARLATPQTVSSLEFHIRADSVRVRARCGALQNSALADTLRALVERLGSQRLWGCYPYRVARMNGDRADLQAESKQLGIPDLITIPMWPGVSGTHATLADGALVVVQFLNGDRARPVITNFVGRGGPGDLPSELEIGGPNGALAARQGDSTSTPLPPAIFSGTIGGVPATGVLVFPAVTVPGAVTGGSAKNVRIA